MSTRSRRLSLQQGVGNLRAVVDKLRAVGNPSRRLAMLWYLARAIQWMKVRRAHDREADVVIWIHHRYPAGCCATCSARTRW